MMVYSRNDSLMCVTFPSSLKGTTSDWFYSLLPHSFYNFEEIIEAFLTQYVSLRHAKKNNYHLISVKMRQGDSLKSTLIIFRTSSPRFSTAVKIYLHSRSSADCMSFTLYIITC